MAHFVTSICPPRGTVDQSALKGNLRCATNKHRGEESKHLDSFNFNTTGRVPEVVVVGGYNCKNEV